MARLTAEREQWILDWHVDYRQAVLELKAELDAVRAERNEYKVWADERHSAALYAEEQNELYHDACDRAEHAEATLAAIRTLAIVRISSIDYLSRAEVLALLNTCDCADCQAEQRRVTDNDAKCKRHTALLDAPPKETL